MLCTCPETLSFFSHISNYMKGWRNEFCKHPKFKLIYILRLSLEKVYYETIYAKGTDKICKSSNNFTDMFTQQVSLSKWSDKISKKVTSIAHPRHSKTVFS